MTGVFRAANAAFDRFLFESCDPLMCSVLRVTVGFLLCIYAIVWNLDGVRWFSDAGVLQAESAIQINAGYYKSLLYFLPQTPDVVRVGLGLLLVQSVLLMLGCWSRFQAACIFVLLTSFQHRNVIILDGQDTVMRWLMLFMAFMPLDHAWSLLRTIGWSGPSTATRASAWAIRLVQIEWTVIYFSTAGVKLYGPTWRDGTALYYVARMDDVFGRFWLPDALFETPWTVKLLTWSVLVLEFVLPFALWIPRLRLWAIFAAMGLHLAIEYSMNLFLFQWLMMAGLLMFFRVGRKN